MHTHTHTNLLELLDLSLIEHGKDVGGGPLATLLRVLLACCLGTTLEGDTAMEGGRG